MARGRMISNEIVKDRRINELRDDTSRLAFTWLVTFADSEGRTYGDPALVRSTLFPRRQDVTVAMMEGYIQEWADLGLVMWYEAEGDMWIMFPAFGKHQVGLRKDREQESRIPAPPPANIQPSIKTTSGITPALLRQSSGKNRVKLIKENHDIKAKEAFMSGDKPPPQPDKRADPRSKLPAIQAIKGITRHYPPLELYDEFICIIGEHPEGERLAECRREWLKRGYNGNGWAWLTDWYKSGVIPPPIKGKQQLNEPAGYQGIRDYLKEQDKDNGKQTGNNRDPTDVGSNLPPL